MTFFGHFSSSDPLWGVGNDESDEILVSRRLFRQILDLGHFFRPDRGSRQDSDRSRDVHRTSLDLTESGPRSRKKVIYLPLANDSGSSRLHSHQGKVFARGQASNESTESVCNLDDTRSPPEVSLNIPPHRHTTLTRGKGKQKECKLHKNKL